MSSGLSYMSLVAASSFALTEVSLHETVGDAGDC
jgi:hypothetical protein